MNKIISINEAVSKVKDEMTLMIGGFMSVGTANNMVDQLVKAGVKNLTIICNDTAFADKGLGKLIANKQVKKVITSHIGTNPATIEQMNNGDIEVEFSPQGTLAERVRSGGSGLGGVLTPTGLGTIIAEGKEVVIVDGKEYLLEKPLRADIALIGASISDKQGNLIYKGTTQNFNPLMATAADLVIAEAEKMVEVGEISPEQVRTPSIFVDYIVNNN
ncbi:CoA transferase subunit A [Marinifilum flexuosum]|uniref:Acetate CoA/acetoacetate CoA-transferase alpha subunit n=1 Tax=Marinifilum flexuosum TaxID=1117708 RepID=A0A419WKV4_9BACT|nr:CoA transferase subunit A [Marinifilum flexuosum]RKD96066.1 acetate CoA/acetoacetate CoA-transferase alpha subunit [Marinifilum flexuosum]